MSNLPKGFVGMDGRIGTKTDGKESKSASSYKGQEVVETHDRTRPEETQYIDNDDTCTVVL